MNELFPSEDKKDNTKVDTFLSEFGFNKESFRKEWENHLSKNQNIILYDYEKVVKK